jgi:hypothetical protein
VRYETLIRAAAHTSIFVRNQKVSVPVGSGPFTNGIKIPEENAKKYQDRQPSLLGCRNPPPAVRLPLEPVLLRIALQIAHSEKGNSYHYQM